MNKHSPSEQISSKYTLNNLGLCYDENINICFEDTTNICENKLTDAECQKLIKKLCYNEDKNTCSENNDCVDKLSQVECDNFIKTWCYNKNTNECEETTICDTPLTMEYECLSKIKTDDEILNDKKCWKDNLIVTNANKNDYEKNCCNGWKIDINGVISCGRPVTDFETTDMFTANQICGGKAYKIRNGKYKCGGQTDGNQIDNFTFDNATKYNLKTYKMGEINDNSEFIMKYARQQCTSENAYYDDSKGWMCGIPKPGKPSESGKTKFNNGHNTTNEYDFVDVDYNLASLMCKQANSFAYKLKKGNWKEEKWECGEKLNNQVLAKYELPPYDMLNYKDEEETLSEYVANAQCSNGKAVKTNNEWSCK